MTRAVLSKKRPAPTKKARRLALALLGCLALAVLAASLAESEPLLEWDVFDSGGLYSLALYLYQR
jgi:peptidoglycan/LPS O-acetylase OafA/YrhL